MESREGIISLEINADNSTELLKEAGGHRIQRVPPTERQGRVHSSTVTVSVVEKNTSTGITFNDRDFRIEWYSGTGAGGQHRNKHQNSCRLTHIPSQEVSTAQCRSRENSLTEAKSALLAKLNSARQGVLRGETELTKKNQTGSGERGDKIRTYRFQDDRVKDHRTGNSASIQKVLSGNFDLLW